MLPSQERLYRSYFSLCTSTWLPPHNNTHRWLLSQGYPQNTSAPSFACTCFFHGYSVTVRAPIRLGLGLSVWHMHVCRINIDKCIVAVMSGHHQQPEDSKDALQHQLPFSQHGALVETNSSQRGASGASRGFIPLCVQSWARPLPGGLASASRSAVLPFIYEVGRMQLSSRQPVEVYGRTRIAHLVAACIPPAFAEQVCRQPEGPLGALGLQCFPLDSIPPSCYSSAVVLLEGIIEKYPMPSAGLCFYSLCSMPPMHHICRA